MEGFVGNLGRDPELKFSPNGVAFAKFSLAVTPRVKNGDTWEDGETVWYQVVSFRALAESVTETLRKGDRVAVVGRVQERSFERKDGTTGMVLEIEATEIGKGLSRTNAFTRSAQEQTGMSSVGDVVAAFGGQVVDDQPPF